MTRKYQIGSVSYLNAKPLIYGLESDDRVSLHLRIPSRLLEGLRESEFDVALLPVIDYQRMEGLRVIPSGGIGSDGPTLTVRIFSRGPIEQIETLACDTDSHTSVALARVVLGDLYGVRPEFVPLDHKSDAGARLLIGDKVIADRPIGFDHQLDLGEAWKRMTGLPFVFAVWMGRSDVNLGDLPAILNDARERGMQNVERIINTHAGPYRWPADVARKYLTEHLQFGIGPRELEAIRRFHARTAGYGLIDSPPRALVVNEGGD
ncbi:MAG: menaquinone biosynthesis protein [Phycisphaerales bacterium]|jgi:chorismate dehydratase|nr:menaquinone biosynthesis protein [Phycisphaerales bacterium]